MKALNEVMLQLIMLIFFTVNFSMFSLGVYYPGTLSIFAMYLLIAAAFIRSFIGSMEKYNLEKETEGILVSYKEVGQMSLDELCRRKGYAWTPEIDRKYKFLKRSARIKNYNEDEIEKILVDVLRNNKYILTRKKNERIELAIQSVEIVLKKQVPRKS